MNPLRWEVRSLTLDLTPRPLVMGIVNVTPDSFSDGGQFLPADAALTHAHELLQQGADLLDIGGESSRPGAVSVPVEEEIARVLPVIEALARSTSAVLSVDTTKPEVADRALHAGAHIINDIRALQNDGMAEVVRQHKAGAVLMHMQGLPATMQDAPHYDDVVREVHEFLQARLQAIADLGIDGSRTVIDPGIGFGKTADHNVRLLANLGRLSPLGRPVLLGVSRKRVLGHLTGRPAAQRDAASLALACHALTLNHAQIIRVHDVQPARDAVLVLAALRAATD